MLHYSPKDVADKTGFSLDTLRYYEKIGLLPSIARSSGGRRVFTEDDVAWLGILQCLRATGMPIARMLRYAKLARGGDQTVAERLGLLEEHDRAIEERIAQLRAKQTHIRQKIKWYRIEVARPPQTSGSASAGTARSVERAPPRGRRGAHGREASKRLRRGSVL
jgi:DNA-binding transcriptional MerR regulator